MPPHDVPFDPAVQDMMVVPRRDAERCLRERAAWVDIANIRLSR